MRIKRNKNNMEIKEYKNKFLVGVRYGGNLVIHA